MAPPARCVDIDVPTTVQLDSYLVSFSTSHQLVLCLACMSECLSVSIYFAMLVCMSVCVCDGPKIQKNSFVGQLSLLRVGIAISQFRNFAISGNRNCTGCAAHEFSSTKKVINKIKMVRSFFLSFCLLSSFFGFVFAARGAQVFIANTLTGRTLSV